VILNQIVEEFKALFMYKVSNEQYLVAIPCYNEELYIGSVILQVKEYIDHILVIDDGSTDKTAVIAERAGAVVMRHASNRGKGAAVSSAFEYASNGKFDALVLIDGDGQHDPAFIPAVLKPVLDGEADMVVGSRYLGVKCSVPFYRMLGQHIITFFTNLGSSVKITDSQSGYRCFSRKAIEAMSFAERGLSVEAEMQFLANEAGLKVKEVPVNILYHDKMKRNPVVHGVGVLNSVIGFISRRIPLFFFGIPGIVMLGFGIWNGWRVVDGYNEFGDFWLGPALIAVLLCIVGCLSIFTGLILHSIKSLLK